MTMGRMTFASRRAKWSKMHIACALESGMLVKTVLIGVPRGRHIVHNVYGYRNGGEPVRPERDCCGK